MWNSSPCLTIPRAFKALRVTLKVAQAFLCLVLLVVWLLGLLFVVSFCLATSMAEAQALLLRNFRVGGAQQSDCADWLTAVTRDLLAPIPFREVFAILALFLPQLPFAEGARVDNQLWSSPVIQQMATEVQVTPVAQGLRECCVLLP